MPGALRLDVPVVPDGDTAREWARRELAEPVYHQQPSLLERLLAWLGELLTNAGTAVQGIDWQMAAVVLAGTAVVVAVVARLVTGPLRRARAAAAGADVFADTMLSAAEHRSAAELAAARDDWHTAVLERFRAIVRTLEERVILDERPGRTAHEATEQASVKLPSLASELRAAGVAFDRVCYGSGRATPELDAQMRQLDRAVGAASPVRALHEVPA